MAIEQPDFSKIFADGATIGELLNMPDEDYLRGWGYLGQNEPPPMEYFNYIYNLQDNKLKYLFISANIRKSNTQYHVDDIVTSPNLQSKFMLVCIQTGTTDSNEPVLDAAEEGQEITDGTAKWRVFSKLASGITIGEEEPVNARDNAVWLALNGIDDIAQLKYQKDGEWKQIFIQSILNGIKDSPIKSLLRNTSYEVNDILADSTCKGAFFICTFAGTTGASVASGFATAEEGQEITDGTAKFKVHYFKEIISSVNIMSGATSSKGGTAGLVPAPDAGKHTSFLRGDGTWQNVPQPVIATQAEAEAGTDNTKHMTPLRVKQAIAKLSEEIPVGSILPFGGNSAPSGFLLCNGAAISRTTYANLYAVIGTTYGSGNGSSTFNVPNASTGRLINGSSLTVVGNGKALRFTDGSKDYGTYNDPYYTNHLGLHANYTNTNNGTAASRESAFNSTVVVGLSTTQSNAQVNMSSFPQIKYIIKY